MFNAYIEFILKLTQIWNKKNLISLNYNNNKNNNDDDDEIK